MQLYLPQESVLPILSRTKIHAIVKYSEKCNWEIGSKIEMVVGHKKPNRTVINKDEAGLDKCKNIQKIDIDWRHDGCYIYIDGILLDFDGMILLAKNEGYQSLTEFYKIYNKNMDGNIIGWTEFRY